MRGLIILLRKSAWLLLPVSLAALLTGYLAVRYDLLPTPLAYQLHTIWIPALFIGLFYVHSIAAILFITHRVKKLNTESARIILSSAWTALFVVMIVLLVIPVTHPVQTPTSPAVSPPTITSLPHSQESFSSNTVANQGAIAGNDLRFIVLSQEEVRRHNTPDDCWIVIDGAVYDVTSYLYEHPAGAETIIPYCGGDATYAFNTLGGRGRPHSDYARSLLAGFYIGKLGEVKTLAVMQEQTSTSTAHQAVLASIEDVRRIIMQKFPGSEIVEIEIKQKDYKVKFILDNNLYEVKLDRNWNIKEIEVKERNITPIVSTQSSTTFSKVVTPSNSPEYITLEEVRRHNNPSNCWIVVDGKVYDVTSYLNQHPAGADKIIPYCGGDATGAFYGVGHSSYAQQLLQQFYVGNLNPNDVSKLPKTPQTNVKYHEEDDHYEEEWDDD